MHDNKSDYGNLNNNKLSWNNIQFDNENYNTDLKSEASDKACFANIGDIRDFIKPFLEEIKKLEHGL
ncbi:3650_t:CDS:2, partial [Gigaspora margarita]